MEALLHLVWVQKLYKELRLGDRSITYFEVIDPGVPNSDAGPDFLNAKIRVDGLVWVGDIEIHHRADEWYQHRHNTDSRYNTVILHVVQHDNAPTHTSDGRTVLTATMSVADELRDRAQYLVQHAEQLACAASMRHIPQIDIFSELDNLAAERLVSKASTMYTLWEQTQDWYEVLYISLMRTLGLGLNNDAMERLARSLPLRSILKQRDRSEQVEAMLLGQAGLIHTFPESTYRSVLEGEYDFLSRKYELKPLPTSMWQMARTRPQSFPLRRLLQLSSIICNDSFSVDRWISPQSLEELYALCAPSKVNPFWYNEGKAVGSIKLSRSTQEIIALNIALPLSVAWGRMNAQEEFAIDQALKLERLMPPENNRYVRLFSTAGITPRHAADGQALIHRYRSYCTLHKCIYCKWGRAFLSHSG